MKLPFDSTEFFQLFGTYNSAIFPLQLILYLLACLAIYSLLVKHKYAVRAGYFLLTVVWLVNGLGYHIAYFSAINKPAFFFGSLFVVQALIFAWLAWSSPLKAPETTPARKATALVLVMYAMVFYSILGYYTGHRYPDAPVFGVAPCPSTIFTFGILLWISGRLRWYFYLIPLLWAVVGTSAAFVLGVREDLGLAVSALVFLAFQIVNVRQARGRSLPAT